MNPYLEQASVWTDFHDTFIPAIRDAIAGQISPEYFVRIEERRVPVPPDQNEQSVAYVTPGDAVPFLEIQSTKGRYTHTTIELLTWGAKYPGITRDEFAMLRGARFTGSKNYVELDLLRGGSPLLIRGLPKCSYYAMVNRITRRPFAKVWAVQLKDRLPSIPVPLADGDGDVLLDLQAVLHDVYDRARYEFLIYDGQPEPALSPEDAEWARQFVPALS